MLLVLVTFWWPGQDDKVIIYLYYLRSLLRFTRRTVRPFLIHTSANLNIVVLRLQSWKRPQSLLYTLSSQVCAGPLFVCYSCYRYPLYVSVILVFSAGRIYAIWGRNWRPALLVLLVGLLVPVTNLVKSLSISHQHTSEVFCVCSIIMHAQHLPRLLGAVNSCHCLPLNLQGESLLSRDCLPLTTLTRRMYVLRIPCDMH